MQNLVMNNCNLLIDKIKYRCGKKWRKSRQDLYKYLFSVYHVKALQAHQIFSTYAIPKCKSGCASPNKNVSLRLL